MKPQPTEKQDQKDPTGSEEQHLDMYEGSDADLRGDLVSRHRTGRLAEQAGESVLAIDEMMNNFNIDMSEDLREGDEMSGDEHSSGLQGGEPELSMHERIYGGMPGEENEIEEREVDRRAKRRAV